MTCKIKRRKLVTFGTMRLDGSPMQRTGSEWRDEECGTPIFGNRKTAVCDSCLRGWTHENNYMLDTAENKNLITQTQNEKI